MPSLFVLPDDLLAECFKHLPPDALARVSAVNKSLRRVANREELWAELCRRCFGDTTAGLVVASHRAVFRRRYCRSRFAVADEGPWNIIPRLPDRARISLSDLQLVFAWKEDWYLHDCPDCNASDCDCFESDVVSYNLPFSAASLVNVGPYVRFEWPAGYVKSSNLHAPEERRSCDSQFLHCSLWNRSNGTETMVTSVGCTHWADSISGADFSDDDDFPFTEPYDDWIGYGLEMETPVPGLRYILVVEVKQHIPSSFHHAHRIYIPGPVRATFLVETSDQGPTQYPFGESFLESALLPMLRWV